MCDVKFEYLNTNAIVRDSVISIANASISIVNECSHNIGLHLGSDTSVCFGDTIILRSNQPFDSYSWSTGQITRSIAVAKPGLYTMTGVDGCQTLTDSIKVDFYPDPRLSISIEPLIASTFEEIKFKSETTPFGKTYWEMGNADSIYETQFSYEYQFKGDYYVKNHFVDQYQIH